MIGRVNAMWEIQRQPVLESSLRGRSPERATAWNSTCGLIFSIAFEDSFRPGATGWVKDDMLDMTMLAAHDSAPTREIAITASLIGRPNPLV
ncbi:hypothetical protein [Mesorhizobium captivum]|uniref:hypothetical protein n=1 Tax=Mesorhizobium captivum TaxID=3072319 RepID=UPI002A23D29F|nr:MULTISPECIES: hypothetical protein [unclassified Mesorhizobium]MDX8502638.1 hypothetical protein [Mesorhizobium sp. VK4C]MDX8514686.1 hypothetical protein [Mesorhizobium sp. VK23E]